MSQTKARRLRFARGPRITLEEYEIPAPGPKQVLVRVTHSHVSAGSEMNFLRHGPAAYGIKGDPDDAVPIGYMSVGRIAAIGPGVTGRKVGDRVITGSIHSDHWLVNPDDPEVIFDPVPENVSDQAAGFAVIGDVSLHCVRRATLQIDESVAIFGMGLIGQLALNFARLSGAYPLIAVDLSDMRLAKAKLSGASHTINAGREDPVKRIREITDGAGAEAVFHCTQVARILQSLMECAADRGKVILTGSAPGKAEITLQQELLRRELTILGIYGRGLALPHAYWPWTLIRNRRASLRLMNSGELKMDSLITHVITPEQAQATFEMMMRENDSWLGVVIKWD